MRPDPFVADSERSGGPKAIMGPTGGMNTFDVDKEHKWAGTNVLVAFPLGGIDGGPCWSLSDIKGLRCGRSRRDQGHCVYERVFEQSELVNLLAVVGFLETDRSLLLHAHPGSRFFLADAVCFKRC